MSQAAAADRRGSPRWRVSRLLGVALPLAIAGASTWALLTLGAGGAPDSSEGLSPAAFSQATGIEILHVAVTAGGGGIDLRFRVTDAEKAAGTASEHHPLVVVDDSGAILRTPFHAMSGGPAYREGRTYFHLLVNQGGAVRAGERVTVAVGHASLADVPVR